MQLTEMDEDEASSDGQVPSTSWDDDGREAEGTPCNQPLLTDTRWKTRHDPTFVPSQGSPSWSYSLISLLLCLLVERSSCSYYSPEYGGDYRSKLSYSGSASKFCYSCMSEDFLSHWPALEEVYYRPSNFTDHCFNIPAKVNIGLSPCSDSLCVTVIEPRILAGQHIGNNIIRGCFTSVFRYHRNVKQGGSNLIDTSCSPVPANNLLPAHLASRTSNRTFELCFCLGQLCNDYPSVPINSAHTWSFAVILVSVSLIGKPLFL